MNKIIPETQLKNKETIFTNIYCLEQNIDDVIDNHKQYEQQKLLFKELKALFLRINGDIIISYKKRHNTFISTKKFNENDSNEFKKKRFRFQKIIILFNLPFIFLLWANVSIIDFNETVDSNPNSPSSIYLELNQTSDRSNYVEIRGIKFYGLDFFEIYFGFMLFITTLHFILMWINIKEFFSKGIKYYRISYEFSFEKEIIDKSFKKLDDSEIQIKTCNYIDKDFNLKNEYNSMICFMENQMERRKRIMNLIEKVFYSLLYRSTSIIVFGMILNTIDNIYNMYISENIEKMPVTDYINNIDNNYIIHFIDIIEYITLYNKCAIILLIILVIEFFPNLYKLYTKLLTICKLTRLRRCILNTKKT